MSSLFIPCWCRLCIAYPDRLTGTSSPYRSVMNAFAKNWSHGNAHVCTVFLQRRSHGGPGGARPLQNFRAWFIKKFAFATDTLFANENRLISVTWTHLINLDVSGLEGHTGSMTPPGHRSRNAIMSASIHRQQPEQASKRRRSKPLEWFWDGQMCKKRYAALPV